MKSKRSQEGYLLIDNSGGPGVDDALVAMVGLPPGFGRGKVEAPTFTCSHCSTVVVMNPLRTRDRGHCPGCDHYLCDTCNLVRSRTGICRTMNQQIEEIQEAGLKALSTKEI